MVLILIYTSRGSASTRHLQTPKIQFGAGLTLRPLRQRNRERSTTSYGVRIRGDKFYSGLLTLQLSKRFRNRCDKCYSLFETVRTQRCSLIHYSHVSLSSEGIDFAGERGSDRCPLLKWIPCANFYFDIKTGEWWTYKSPLVEGDEIHFQRRPESSSCTWNSVFMTE